MSYQQDPHSSRRGRGSRRRKPRTADADQAHRSASAWRYAAAPLLVLVLASLACGSFAPRPTPEPEPTVAPSITEVAAVEATATSALPTSVPTRAVPTPTLTPTPVPGTVLMVGQPARVVAAQGLNVRKEASVSGERTGRFAPGAVVSILEGPVDIDSYRWWRVGNNELSGWVAEGDGTDQWLSPEVGKTQPVDRPVKLGDQVLVTVGADGFLKVRAEAGTGAKVDHQLTDGAQLSVTEGPVEANGYRWWKVTNGGDITGWAAEGDGTDRWLTPLE